MDVLILKVFSGGGEGGMGFPTFVTKSVPVFDEIS